MSDLGSDEVLNELREPDERERDGDGREICDGGTGDDSREPGQDVQTLSIVVCLLIFVGEGDKGLAGDRGDEWLDVRLVRVIECLQFIEIDFVSTLTTEKRVNGRVIVACSVQKSRRGAARDIGDVLGLELGESSIVGRENDLAYVWLVRRGDIVDILLRKVGRGEVLEHGEEHGEAGGRGGGLGVELLREESKEAGEELNFRLGCVFYGVYDNLLLQKLVSKDLRCDPFVSVGGYWDGNLEERKIDVSQGVHVI